MPNLDIIYDVTTEVTWDEKKTNKQVIYRTTSLPSFVTFDAFYFCLWPKTLSFERYLGGNALATDHRGKCQTSTCNNWPLTPVSQQKSCKASRSSFVGRQVAEKATKSREVGGDQYSTEGFTNYTRLENFVPRAKFLTRQKTSSKV